MNGRGDLKHYLWCAVVGAVAVVPNVAAVVAPFESWPYTCAPMFAASPVSNDRYEVDFVIEKRDGTTTMLPEKAAVGLNDWHFRRSFLSVAWGSDDDRTAFGHRDNDTPALRQKRVERYLAGVVTYAQSSKRGRHVFDGARAIRIDLRRDPNSTTTNPTTANLTTTQELTTLGRYEIAPRRFTFGGP